MGIFSRILLKRGDIVFNINLKQLAKYELAFLKSIDRNKLLAEDNVIRRAIWRYEVFWLPLLARNQSFNGLLSPPQDIHWVWHCHLLSPKHYRKDCRLLVGMQVHHKIQDIASKEFQEAQKLAESLWYNRYGSAEPFIASYDKTLPIEVKIYKRKSSYDLLQATKRQAGFFYNVSLPHYHDSDFLETAVTRYKKFLRLIQDNPSKFIVPCYDIDLI